MSTAKNKTKLAEALNISRQSLYDWALLPGAPKAKSGKNDVAAWQEFIGKNGLKSAPKGELYAAKLAGQLLDNRLRNLKLMKARSELLPLSLGQFLLGNVMIAVRSSVMNLQVLDDHSKREVLKTLKDEMAFAMDAAVRGANPARWKEWYSTVGDDDENPNANDDESTDETGTSEAGESEPETSTSDPQPEDPSAAPGFDGGGAEPDGDADGVGERLDAGL